MRLEFPLLTNLIQEITQWLSLFVSFYHGNNYYVYKEHNPILLFKCFDLKV